MRATRWSRRPGVYSIEIELIDGRVCDFDGKEMPASVQQVADLLWQTGGYAELEIHFLDSGYYDPGRTYGDPYDCYPPEGDNEREFNFAVLVIPLTQQKRILNEIGQAIFDDLFDEIEEVEIEHDNGND